jgi:hypothetical protein
MDRGVTAIPPQSVAAPSLTVDAWSFPKAKAAALKALEFDSHLAEAHTSLALARMVYDRDWAGTESSYQ